MNNCNCNKPQCGLGAIPNHTPTSELCGCKPDKITLRTVVLPASLGTDAEGQPYAPKAGAYYNTVVAYLANNNVYIYDSNGVYTLLEDGVAVALVGELQTQVEEIAKSTNVLYHPWKVGLMVNTYEDLSTINPTDYPMGTRFEVVADAEHDNEPSYYYWNTGLNDWSYDGPVVPFYTREFVNNLTTALQTNINQIFNKEAIDVENLQTNINKEVEAREEAINEEITAREAADNNLQSQIDTINDSTDVKDVVGTYAELEAYDTTNLGDNDIIKVLDDETHEGAITYYRWNKTEGEFTYIGETGPYYTKAQIDAKFDNLGEELTTDYATIAYVNEQIGNINTELTTIDTGAGV